MAGSDGVWDAAKRSFGGGAFFMTRYASTTQSGPGRSYIIQRHGFLAGLEGSELSTAFQPDHLGSAVFGGFGFLLQRLEGVGHAWIELAGEISEYDLVEGQSLRVHPAHIGVIEGSVDYELTTVPGIKNKV